MSTRPRQKLAVPTAALANMGISHAERTALTLAATPRPTSTGVNPEDAPEGPDQLAAEILAQDPDPFTEGQPQGYDPADIDEKMADELEELDTVQSRMDARAEALAGLQAQSFATDDAKQKAFVKNYKAVLSRQQQARIKAIEAARRRAVALDFSEDLMTAVAESIIDGVLYGKNCKDVMALCSSRKQACTPDFWKFACSMFGISESIAPVFYDRITRAPAQVPSDSDQTSTVSDWYTAGSFANYVSLRRIYNEPFTPAPAKDSPNVWKFLYLWVCASFASEGPVSADAPSPQTELITAPLLDDYARMQFSRLFTETNGGRNFALPKWTRERMNTLNQYMEAQASSLYRPPSPAHRVVAVLKELSESLATAMQNDAPGAPRRDPQLLVNAVRDNNVVRARELLEDGVPPDMKHHIQYYGPRPQMPDAIAKVESADMLYLLLEYGVLREMDRRALLQRAMMKNADIASTLLKLVKNLDASALLMNAAAGNGPLSLHMTKELLEKYPANPRLSFALHYAAAASNDATARLLLENGAQPDGGMEPFSALSLQRQPGKSQALNDWEDDVFYANKTAIFKREYFVWIPGLPIGIKGLPLTMACAIGHFQTIKVLLDAGANPSIKFGSRIQIAPGQQPHSIIMFTPLLTYLANNKQRKASDKVIAAIVQSPLWNGDERWADVMRLMKRRFIKANDPVVTLVRARASAKGVPPALTQWPV